jgi:hypothetical protein
MVLYSNSIREGPSKCLPIQYFCSTVEISPYVDQQSFPPTYALHSRDTPRMCPISAEYSQFRDTVSQSSSIISKNVVREPL